MRLHVSIMCTIDSLPHCALSIGMCFFGKNKYVAAIACSVPGYFHGRSSVPGFTCAAVTRSGDLYTWGPNHSGQLMRRSGNVPHAARPGKVSFGADRAQGSVGRIGRVTMVACGRQFTAIHTVDRDDESGLRVLTSGRFCGEPRHELRSWAALDGLSLRQLAAGAFHCCCVTTSGELYTWGHPWGNDHSNGNLLASGPPAALRIDAQPDADDNAGATQQVLGLEVSSDVFGVAHGTRLPRRVTAHAAGEAGMGAVAEVSCSTYSTLAITVDGRAFAWGDSDGDSLGHSVDDCHIPHRLTSLAGLRVAHGALCYTNGAAALTDGQVYVWGGGMWQGGIGGGSEGPQRVGFGGGVPPCYRCSSVALGSWHGYLVLRRLP